MSNGSPSSPEGAVPDDDEPSLDDLVTDICAKRPKRLRFTRSQLVELLEEVEIEKAQLADEVSSALADMRKTLERTPALAVDLVTNSSDDTDGESKPENPAKPGRTFPEQTSEGALRVKRPKKWRAWVGNSERLVKLAETVESSLRSHFERHAEDDAAERLAYRTDDLAYMLKVEVRASKGKVQRSGHIRTVLGETNLDEIDSVFIGNSPLLPAEYDLPLVQIRLGRTASYDFDGVSLEVSDSDRDWVASTFDKLATDLQHDVPAWAWLRSPVASVPTYAVVATVLWSVSIPIVNRLDSTAWAVTVAVANGALSVLCVVVMNRFVLRPVEVLQLGQTSSPRRKAAVLIGGVGLIGAIASIVALFL